MKGLALVIIGFLGCCLALANGNPGAGKEWTWTSRMPKVSVNPPPMSTFVPKSPNPYQHVPGTIKVENCGTKPKSSRIVGGEEATPHSYPWQVGLYFSGGWFCGGSIISDEWVLTAAHCTDGAIFVDVVMGAHNIHEEEPSQVSVLATDITTHENYDSIMLQNDVGIIKLPEPITFNEYIQPICLPSYSECETDGEFVGMPVTASGWGKDSDSASGISSVLNNVDTTTISVADCSGVYGDVASENVLCTSAEGGHGTCSGDSGGPLNYLTGGVTQTRGITSFVASAGCESGYPDGFTRVCSYLSWIETNTGIAIDP